MALSHILYFRILSSAGPTNLLLKIFMTPVLTIWFVISILFECIDLLHQLGVIVIGLGSP
ncbi:MAG: hypothetical protein CMM55_14820 [Rhodospirillaceae bacterium]|nr:hypothetical protein [Rhodospirillaceae bacterium]